MCITDEKQLLRAEAMLNGGDAVGAVAELERLACLYPGNDRILYLRGNARRKTGNWAAAINDYLEAASINPDSPAAEAAAMLTGILEFRNKDLYNQ
jgi:tetratricopeptide (TPR) repeat protein